MNFWDTIMGHRLAEVLIDCLPKLTKEKSQYIKYIATKDDAIKYIIKEIKDGNKYIEMIEDESGFLVIMEAK